MIMRSFFHWETLSPTSAGWRAAIALSLKILIYPVVFFSLKRLQPLLPVKTDPHYEHPDLKGTVGQSPRSSGETPAALPAGCPSPAPSPPSASPDPWPSSHLFGEDRQAPCSQRRAGCSHSLKQTHGQHAGSDKPHWEQRALGWSCCVGPPGPHPAASVRPPGLPGGKSPWSLPPAPPASRQGQSLEAGPESEVCAADPGVVARLRHSRAPSGSSSLACLRQCPCLPGLPAAGTRGLDAHWLPELTSVSTSSPVIKLGGQALVSRTLLQRLTDKPLELEWLQPSSY
ncbi:unnamed protein product [Rangifer tarandus platyrhynchus]|uniref:Uncharacterized protein n=2 Tax=Rangifer tarandus platyrhynchus TaxID=3082113 RepID=A0ACB0E6L2_RANTA|nr:unnamed protein product [Rangifer tarandus platyrhynchus]CAI9695901.1 unnamed protein product [Rangifer tarandus platyrhynchus]